MISSLISHSSFVISHSDMVYVIMGVSGCGKTAVGEALVAKLGLPFYDGDQFHPPANVAKMSASIPLNDDDREPWLRAMAAKIREWNAAGGAILGCSALKKKYRDTLREGSKVTFVFLDGTKELLAKRLHDRKGHFFPPSLLDSQFDTLERPANAIRVSIDQELDAVVTEIVAKIKAYKP